MKHHMQLAIDILYCGAAMMRLCCPLTRGCDCLRLPGHSIRLHRLRIATLCSHQILFDMYIIRSMLLFGTLMLTFYLYSQGDGPMIDLPVNDEVRARTYAFCLCKDEARVTDLLRQRLEYAGHPNAARTAQTWVRSGYCRDFLRDADEYLPSLRKGVLDIFKQEDLNPDSPPSSGQALKLGKVIKGIGKFLGGIFKGGAGGRGIYRKTTTTSADGSSTTTETCDRSWHIGSGSGSNPGGSGPFIPHPPMGG